MQHIGVGLSLVCGAVLLAVGCDKTGQRDAAVVSSEVSETPAGDAVPLEKTENQPFHLALPDRGVLSVRIPEGMTARETAAHVAGSACLRIEGSNPEPCVMTLTVLGEPGMIPGFGSASWFEEELDRWKSALPDPALAAEAVSVPFQLDTVSGVYVTLHDPSAAGPYACLLQGFFNVDGCIVSFQALHNETRASAANRFLALLLDAAWEPHPEPEPAPVS